MHIGGFPGSITICWPHLWVGVLSYCRKEDTWERLLPVPACFLRHLKNGGRKYCLNIDLSFSRTLVTGLWKMHWSKQQRILLDKNRDARVKAPFSFAFLKTLTVHPFYLKFVGRLERVVRHPEYFMLHQKNWRKFQEPQWLIG